MATLVVTRRHKHRRDYGVVHRIKILESLRDKPLLMTNIMQKAALSWKDTIKQLSLLTNKGLVSFTGADNPNSRRIGYYSITQSGLDILEAVKPLV